MKRINLLDIETCNKIAAGEVVERPSSVVKELVENSIDAKATKITVEIENGGETLIKIIDNGVGIHIDDIEKAFLPHATSKIKEINDIFSINTLGFRGEALASISAVSKVKLFSKTEEFDFGREIFVEGGTINYIKEAGCNNGTVIEVRDLFFNVPARKKFMKSTSRESALINDMVSKIALSNPGVSITLINNGKKVITTYGNNNYTDIVRAIYGKNISENLIYFEGFSDLVSVHGYIGNADISRGSRTYQSIFVNNRYIKNKTITTAVENAFKSFLTINKFPFFILFIDIFPEYIDVNIHPTKAEIKFQDDRPLFKIVFKSVHEALKKSLENNFSIEGEEEKQEEVENVTYFDHIDEMEYKKDVSIPIDFNQRGDYIGKTESSLDTSYYRHLEGKEEVTHKDILKEDKGDLDKYKAFPVEKNIEYAKFPKLRVIGQFNKTYIIGEFNETLYLIDQHAAHEKIMFEKYMDDIKKGSVIAQPLLIPVVIDLSLDDFGVYEENKDFFKTGGFHIEDFGETTISVRQVPYIFGKLDMKNLFMSILDNLKNLGSGKTEEVKFHKIASMACKSAIKANDSLSKEEMDELLEQLRYIKEPFTCPHGRPTIIKMGLYELEKRFKRIQ